MSVSALAMYRPVETEDETDPDLLVAPDNFLIERVPNAATARAVVVSVPHFGIGSPRRYTAEEFATHLGRHLAFGFQDAYVPHLYGRLDEQGAHVVATQLSRLFVDVNRPRDDFERRGDEVHSRSGVVRTHSRRGTPIFTTAPTMREASKWLVHFYDPYYAALERGLASCIERFQHAVLLDLHTASAQRMGKHQIVLGTSRRRTAAPGLVEVVYQLFSSHGFKCDIDVPGYVGANIVRTFGAHVRDATDAIQIEVSAGLLQTMAHDEFVRTQIGGRRPAPDPDTLARLRACIAEVLQAADTYARACGQSSGQEFTN